MGFIVQSGFIEATQSKYLEHYLSALIKRLIYTYLGAVIKGGSVGIYMMPENMNKKLFAKLHSLGEQFEIEGAFVQEVMKELGSPEML